MTIRTYYRAHGASQQHSAAHKALWRDHMGCQGPKSGQPHTYKASTLNAVLSLWPQHGNLNLFYLLLSSLSRILWNVSVNSVFSVKSRSQSHIKLYEQTTDVQFLMLSHNTEAWHFIVWQRSRKLSPRASLNHTQEQEASSPNPSLQKAYHPFLFLCTSLTSSL